MLTIIQGMLDSYISNSISVIKTAVSATDAVMLKVAVKCAEENQYLKSLGGNKAECTKSSSSYDMLKLLRELIEGLSKEKELLLSLQAATGILSHESDENSLSPVGAKEKRLTIEEITFLCNILEKITALISEDIVKSYTVTDSVCEAYFASEAEKMCAAHQEYRRAAAFLKNACDQAYLYLNAKKIEYKTGDTVLSADYKLPSENESSTYASDSMSDGVCLSRSAPSPIPPVPPLYSMPSAPPSYSMPPADYGKSAVREEKSASAPEVNGGKKRTGLLGLFRRKEKDSDGIQPEQIAPPRIDSVQFSAIAADRAVPGKYLPVSIVMYEDEFRKAVDDIARSYGKNVREAKSGYREVERNSQVRVVLSSDDVKIEDNEEVQRWNGKYLNFEFVAKVPEDFGGSQILLTASVYINDLIAARLKLILDCEKKSKRSISIEREDIVSAFVSYASQDRNRVAAIIQGMQKARPDMDIFFDIESLRSGQHWEEVLKSEIASRDVLFLCWSKYARDSRWVDMEWRYALESKGEASVEPIPIDSPDVCPPPVELQQKHFNDKMLYIIKATEQTVTAQPGTEQTGTAQPYLLRIKTNEFTCIDKPVVRIGKNENYADLVISDNPAVSRHHADIICSDNKYYIADMNSTNHTYVDGQMIPGSVKTQIKHGTMIMLADEKFVFYC